MKTLFAIIFLGIAYFGFVIRFFANSRGFNPCCKLLILPATSSVSVASGVVCEP